MNLELFFDKPSLSNFDGQNHKNTWFEILTGDFSADFSWQNAEIAIIGVDDKNGSENKSMLNAADAVRQKLYRLQKGRAHKYNIVDLGNLRLGDTENDTKERLSEVCYRLLQKNVLPIIIGGSHDLTLAQYEAYKPLDKMLSLLCVDAKIDLDTNSKSLADSFMDKILKLQPNYLFTITHLASQEYLIPLDFIKLYQKLNFDIVGVGKIRDKPKEIEPLVRTSDLLSFDLSAIRAADAAANKLAQPFGLSAEEATRICWYAGNNVQMTSIGFYEYNPDLDIYGHTASIISTMIWYFVEGFYNRQAEYDFGSPFYIKYLVAMGGRTDFMMVFYKSKLTDKWWLEVPAPHFDTHSDNELDENPYQRPSIIPCSYNDYQQANRGEMPERWIKMYNRLF
ncbi:arginase family protein [Bernardetia sp. OM2101]|uniref:arginase family protein n=1 Tax=Bernardetia sp. OM2101 TaxID=3344876 RepID=UPI0035CF01D6